MAQVPPPPHADGKNIPVSDNVDSKVFPGFTVSSFSSLIVIFTCPVAVSFALAKSKVATKTSTIARNAIMLDAITNIVEPKIIGFLFYSI
jgi:hypothetical protein